MKNIVIFLVLVSLSFAGCVKRTGNDEIKDTSSVTQTTRTTTILPQTVTMNYNYPVTLPVLDAFMQDSSFVRDLKQQASLSDTDIAKLRAASHQAAMRPSSDTVSTTTARAEARNTLQNLLGPEKENKVIQFVQARWSGTQTSNGNSTGTDSSASGSALNQVPADSRIVVNIPEYRMDVFDAGKLIKSYTVAIGYPEFPLPTGLRRADEIIFNPSWTTPDEAWVQNSKKVQVGQKVGAGDKLNPLGMMKIPIGLPSLIHGGKSPAAIGGFGSHGCVGLTDPEAHDFVKQIAHLTGLSLTEDSIKQDTKDKKKSTEVKFAGPVPVELRYETIVVENGALHIMRDVYDHNMNTEDNLKSVLASYSISEDNLTADEKSKVLSAIQQMSVPVIPKTDSLHSASNNLSDSSTKTKSGSKHAIPKHGNTKSKSKLDLNNDTPLTKKISGPKEIVIPIAALNGKGYPSPILK